MYSQNLVGCECPFFATFFFYLFSILTFLQILTILLIFQFLVKLYFIFCQLSLLAFHEMTNRSSSQIILEHICMMSHYILKVWIYRDCLFTFTDIAVPHPFTPLPILPPPLHSHSYHDSPPSVFCFMAVNQSKTSYARVEGWEQHFALGIGVSQKRLTWSQSFLD